MNPIHCSTTLLTTLTLLSALGVAGFPQSAAAQEKTAAAREKIGIYDSRALAVAFIGSPAHKQEIDQLRAKHQKAKQAGDLEAAAKLEAEGKALQVKAHKQGFSTAPVDDILAHMTNSIPKIQQSAGVTAIVSKWDEAGLKKHPGAETVDVTMNLVDALKPSPRQRETAIQIQKTKPISLEQAEHIDD